MRGRIEAANAAIARVRILSRVGFATVDRKAYATLASLHNNGRFRARALLIGSHAYGALLNSLGVRAAGYTTQDVDIERPGTLALPCLDGFFQMLRETASSSSRYRPSISVRRLHRLRSGVARDYESSYSCHRRMKSIRPCLSPSLVRMQKDCLTSRICWGYHRTCPS